MGGQAKEVRVGASANLPPLQTHDRLIDAEALLESTSIEELASRADELVRSMEDPSALLAKPCSSLREAPDLLACFGLLLSGLAPVPGMRILDFGAGSCWTSHFLTQLGCRVVAMDISESMLDLGRRRYEQQPVFGEQPEPEFVVFDGHHMDLADASVDRVLCFDALHHVANMQTVLAEMARVLRPGGMAGFSEPGPHHSRDPQSQHEMRRYGVPERDLVLEDVWGWASESGFSELSVAVFAPSPQWVSLEAFNAFVEPRSAALTERAAQAVRPRGKPGVDRVLGQLRRVTRLAKEVGGPESARGAMSEVLHVRGQLSNRRMFVMRREGEEIRDSREASGLAAEIVVEKVEVDTGPETSRVAVACTVENTGPNRWLASSAGKGAVLLGLRLRRGMHPATDHGRVALPGGGVLDPGGRVHLEFETELETPASWEAPVLLELDVVSEGISWFAEVRGHPIEIPIPRSAGPDQPPTRR
jgi:2-polyprenyl-3-methyl-5-hydroxy-6-metoxy-1,4-benzoquinol methylase